MIQQLKNNLIAAATGFRYNEDNNENNEVEPMAFTTTAAVEGSTVFTKYILVQNAIH